MILAAGFGTRLGEVGKSTPKCLLEAGGKTMLEHVIVNLKRAGVDYVVINLHHLGDKIKKFVSDNSNFGITVQFSAEAEILGTGGGVLNARCFLEDAGSFFIHNADIYSEFDLKQLAQFHAKSGTLACLAVMKRETKRPLIFDKNDCLVGWEGGSGESQVLNQDSKNKKLAFSGIQIVSSQIFKFMESSEAPFSTISTYMQAAEAGEKILAFDTGKQFWMDIGTPEKIKQLREKLN